MILLVYQVLQFLVSNLIDEGESATFTIAADSIGADSLSVRVRITRDGNFFAADKLQTDAVTIIIPPDGQTQGRYVITESTENDGIEEDDGSIVVRVLTDTDSPATYSVGEDSSQTTRVKDDDDNSLPNITIVGGSKVTEGPDVNAVFTLTATSVGSATSVDVRVQVSQSGNFLSTAAGVRIIPVTIGSDPKISTNTSMPEAIMNDTTDEVHGSITATILKDNVGIVDYGIGRESTATIQVEDDDVPILSIADGVKVKESDTPGSPAYARFTISTPIAPLTNNFTIRYTPISTNFVVDSGVERTSHHQLNFTDPDGDTYLYCSITG